MPNIFDDYAQMFVSDSIQEFFGERDEHGDLAVISYWAPGKNAEKVALLGCVVDAVRVSDEVGDEHGTHLRDQIEDIVTVTIPTTQAGGSFVPVVDGKLHIERLGEVAFSIIEIPKQDGALARVQASRKHIKSIRRAGSERG